MAALSLVDRTHSLNRKLERFSLLPGWDVYAVPSVLGATKIVMTAPVVDSRGTGLQIEIKNEQLWYPEMEYRYSDYLNHFIREMVRTLLLHEADEWIRYDGELLFDPHTNG